MYTEKDDEVVAVIGKDRHTDFIKAVTSCDRKDSRRYANYYRKIGYNASVVTYEELDRIQEEEKQGRMEYVF